MIKFTLDITPESMQKESRIGMMKPKPGKTSGRGFMFSTDKKKKYLAQIALLARPYAPKAPWTGPIHLEALFVLPRPKYAMGKAYDDGLIWAPQKPDSTNILKNLEDGLTDAGFWIDDKQVVRQKVRKVFTEKTGFPRFEVGVEEFGGSLL